jgi:hypothetical protein
MDMNTRLVALFLGHERTRIEIYVNVIDQERKFWANVKPRRGL